MNGESARKKANMVMRVSRLTALRDRMMEDALPRRGKCGPIIDAAVVKGSDWIRMPLLHMRQGTSAETGCAYHHEMEKRLWWTLLGPSRIANLDDGVWFRRRHESRQLFYIALLPSVTGFFHWETSM